jgi:hypothetical protein
MSACTSACRLSAAGLALVLLGAPGRADDKKDQLPRKDDDKVRPAEPADRVAPPSKERVAAGTNHAVEGHADLLLARGADGWRRLTPRAAVTTAEPLVCLPGAAAELRLTAGARLALRGLTPELARHPVMSFLLDSAVTLHKPAPGIDVDLTLHRGRVYISQDKPEGRVVVRVRFADQAWDLTLHGPGTEVGLDLNPLAPREADPRDVEPQADAVLKLLKGEADLKIDFHVYKMAAPPGPCALAWSNRGPRTLAPQRIVGDGLKSVLDIWSKDAADTPAARAVQKALADLAAAWGDRKPEAVLAEAVAGPEAARRHAAVLALAAVGDLPRLLDVLDDSDPAHQADRDLAVFALRRYLSRGPEAGKAVYDPKAQAGALVDKKFKTREAATVADLLYDFPERVAQSPETYQLLLGMMSQEGRVALRELAWWHLARMAQPVKLPEYNAAWPADKRRAAVADVQKLLDERKLPPKRP